LTGYIGTIEGKGPFPGAPPDIIRATGSRGRDWSQGGLLGFYFIR
jgi:hypothetical protein